MPDARTARRRAADGDPTESSHPAPPRQQTLTGELRCHYDEPQHRQLRPDCQAVAVVAYGRIQLCAACDAMRSTVGKGIAARTLPGAELGHLKNAAQAETNAKQQLTHAVLAALDAGASWTQIGHAIGLTRQAAQQRWRHR
jgi:hypothetical protein